MGQGIVEKKFVANDIPTALALFGDRDRNLRALASNTMVSFVPRGNEVAIKGDAASVDKVLRVLDELAKIATEREVNLQELGYALELAERGQEQALTELESDVIQVTCRGKKITPRTTGQRRYVQAVRENGIVFCIGPAGTGKTYLAMAMAVAELKAKRVGRIILTRPAVEAGERLGFLPGDLQDKVDPYLRPLYDALYDILGAEIYEKYSEKGIIEVAPLAYMRGRTLDDSFIILDEAQNTTPEQMKMFLTRMGFGSKMIITGDITQVDLPRDKSSGLQQVQGILRDVEGIEFVYLDNRDVVRHELVQRIIKAYDLFEQKQVVAEKDGVINNGVVEEV